MGCRSGLIATAVALGVLATLPQAASAGCTEIQRHVTTTVDETDPSDGVLSLREAAADANADTTAGHCQIIDLPNGHYTLGSVVTMTAVDALFSPGPPTATARDVVIDGGGTTSLFDVTAGQSEFYKLTLTKATTALINGATVHVRESEFYKLTLTNATTALINGANVHVGYSEIVDNHGANGGAVRNEPTGTMQI